eukprot:gene18858-6233_t
MARTPLQVFYTFLCGATILGEPFFYIWFSPLVAAVVKFTTATGVMFLDFIVDPDRSWHNLEQLEANGYSKSSMFLLMMFNIATTITPIGYVWMMYITPVNELAPYFSLGLVATTVGTLALTEIGFTFAHTKLHESPTLSKFHILHHCCTKSSWSTNGLFHPLDLSLEFTGPVAAVLGLHLLHGNAWQTCVSYYCVQLWYGMDHDATLNLNHNRNHHGLINANYTVYISQKMQQSIYKSDPKDDHVRHVVKPHPAAKAKPL